MIRCKRLPGKIRPCQAFISLSFSLVIKLRSCGGEKRWKERRGKREKQKILNGDRMMQEQWMEEEEGSYEE